MFLQFFWTSIMMERLLWSNRCKEKTASRRQGWRRLQRCCWLRCCGWLWFHVRSLVRSVYDYAIDHKESMFFTWVGGERNKPVSISWASSQPFQVVPKLQEYLLPDKAITSSMIEIILTLGWIIHMLRSCSMEGEKKFNCSLCEDVCLLLREEALTFKISFSNTSLIVWTCQNVELR